MYSLRASRTLHAEVAGPLVTASPQPDVSVSMVGSKEKREQLVCYCKWRRKTRDEGLRMARCEKRENKGEVEEFPRREGAKA